MRNKKNQYLRKKAVLFLLTAVLSACLMFISGCGQRTSESDQPIDITSFKLNTIVKITIYDSQDKLLLDECLKLCDKYESVFSSTREDSELYKLNHRELPALDGTSNTYRVSKTLAELLNTGLNYTRESHGAFNIAIAPLTTLWDFTSKNPQVPDKEQLRGAVSSCSYDGVHISGTDITLESADTEFDLGGIAKGYIADNIKKYLVSQGVKSAIINLGGNVVCIGEKENKAPFLIGIQKPFADRNETIAAIEIEDKSIVSSGIYERFFEKDGTLYHHILNPNDGYPYGNDLVAVTIISDKSVDGDALSTTCFALGYEKGLEYIQSLDDIDAIFITKDYELHYSENFQERYPLKDADGNDV